MPLVGWPALQKARYSPLGWSKSWLAVPKTDKLPSMCDLYLHTTLQKTWKEQKRMLAEGNHGQGAQSSPGTVLRQVWGQAGKSICGSGPIRSPFRQVTLGTSPVMSLVMQVRCQKYDFLSAVNSTLSYPLSTSTFFQTLPSVWFAHGQYYCLLKEICSSKIMHLRQKLPLSVHQNCSTAQVKTSTLD